MPRIKREILEALWSDSQDARENSAQLRERVIASQRRSAALRDQIAFARATANRLDGQALIKT
jgi:hypothetical protein